MRVRSSQSSSPVERESRALEPKPPAVRHGGSATWYTCMDGGISMASLWHRYTQPAVGATLYRVSMASLWHRREYWSGGWNKPG
jgi:hypothetical protein